MAEREIERWITVNGSRIPIFKGESEKDAVNRSIADKNEKTKNEQIAKRKEDIDKLNGKSTSQKNAEALGIDYKKNAEKLVKEFERKKAELEKTPHNQTDKYLELNKWLIKSQNEYHRAKNFLKNNK